MDDRQTQDDGKWPRAWLMTDDRMGQGLWDALARLPAGDGVVLRDSSLGERVASFCRDRGLKLAVTRDVALAEALGAALVHNPGAITKLPFSRSVHDEAEARRAKAGGATLVFVSPVFPTRSHPDGDTLGLDEAARLAKIAGVPAIALGGMNEERFAALAAHGFYGWAGIDAWLDQARLRI